MLYPQLNESRCLIDLSGIWSFRKGTEEFESEYMLSAFEEYDTMAVPASYNDQKVSAELKEHYGYVYYQKQFSLPKYISGQRIVLRFGAVTHKAVVYLNGRELIKHKGGFLPFEAEITDSVQKNNLLCVAVDNTIDFSTLPVGNEERVAMFGSMEPDFESVRQTKVKKRNFPNFDFFNYGGINRPVKIYTTPEKTYIKDMTVISKICGDTAVINFSSEVSGEAQGSITVTDKQGNVVAEAEGTCGSVVIEKPHLWWPSEGYLYKLNMHYGEDFYSLSFGIRSVEVKGEKFLINGKSFYFKGFGKHEDSENHGRGLDEVLNVKDIALMKWMGANSFRTSHYPYSEEMLSLCDEEGIVVIGEAPAVGLNFPNLQEDWYKDLSRTYDHHCQVIRDMIKRDKNHPCIVMWSLANEPDTEKRNESALEYFRPLYDLAHSCDPESRPVTLVVCNNDYLKDLTAPYMDVICINRYYGWYIFGGNLDAAGQAMKTEMEYWKQFGKPMLMTEYGADTVAGIHNAVADMFSEEYQMEYYKTMNDIFDQYSYFAGEHAWNFADFATVQGILRVDGNKKGLFTRSRRPKLAAHYFRQRWQNIPDFGYKDIDTEKEK